MKNLSVAAWCLLLLMVSVTGCASVGAKGPVAENKDHTEVKLMVLYPHPTDVTQFDTDYRDHLKLLHEKANIPEDAPLPYSVTKFHPTPDGPAPFYQLFTMHFESAEALQKARSSLEEVAADAVRISSGGAPVVLVGSETP